MLIHMLGANSKTKQDLDDLFAKKKSLFFRYIKTLSILHLRTNLYFSSTILMH